MVTTPVLTTKVDPVEALEDDYDYDASSIPPEQQEQIPQGMELVDGTLVEKTGMTAKHGITQVKLAVAWTNYKTTTQVDGEVFAETACATQHQKRRPDVSYGPQTFVQTHGKPGCYPVAFPLIGEIASPDDPAEMLFDKAYEYLAAGAEEVWILLPETQLAFIVLSDQLLVFTASQTIATQKVLPGFAIDLQELFT
jgi:Uma2 family endonuclease